MIRYTNFYYIKLRNKNNYEIVNLNETHILNLSASTTLQTIGSKKVNIRTQGQESWRITVILKILASGESYQIINL